MTRFQKKLGTPEFRRIFQRRRDQLEKWLERWGVEYKCHIADTGTRYYELYAEGEDESVMISVRLSDHPQVYPGAYFNIDPEVDQWEDVKAWIQQHGTKPGRWTIAQAKSLAEKLRKALPEKYEVEVVDWANPPITRICCDGYVMADRDHRGWFVEYNASEELKLVLRKFGYREKK